MVPFLDKEMPEVWAAAQKFSVVVGDSVRQRGLSDQETELINLRVSQINGCTFCLDLHGRQARQAGVTQQKLDLLPGWRESALFTDRETAVLAVAEAATVIPLTDEGQADLVAARSVLGDEAFVAAEWVASAINLFNRISILSRHPVRARDAAGKVIR